MFEFSIILRNIDARIHKHGIDYIPVQVSIDDPLAC